MSKGPDNRCNFGSIEYGGKRHSKGELRGTEEHDERGQQAGRRVGKEGCAADHCYAESDQGEDSSVGDRPGHRQHPWPQSHNEPG